MPTRPKKVDGFTQLITLLLGEGEYNTLEHNENNISPLEKDQLLSLYNGLHNKKYQDLKKYTPQSEFTDKIYTRICLVAVQEDGLALKLVPEKNKSEEICLSAVQENGLALKFVPKEELSYKICLEAVKKYGLALELVPEKNKSEEICLSAVQENGLALKFVPKEERNYKICLEAVQENDWALQFIPKNEHSEEIYLAAVQKNGLALELVPEEERNYEICLKAVQENGLALKFVPKEERSYKICLEAVQENGWALEFVPEKNKSEEIYLAAVKKNSLLLEFVPEGMRLPIMDNIKIEHVTVTKKYMGEEEKIMFLVYGSKQKRLGKTIHTENESVDQLFNDLMKMNKRDINLVLIGLSVDEKNDKIADLSIEDIISLLEKYDNINRVTLLTCHSAKSNQLNFEKEMLSELSSADKEQSEKKHGLMLATESFFNDEKPEKLIKGFDIVYVIKSLSSGKYGLASVEKDVKTGIIKKKDIKIPLDEEDVIALQSLSDGTRKKGFDEVLGKRKHCLLKTKEHPLNIDELDVISSIIKSPEKFYLFNKSATIYDKKEIEELKPSLLKKLVTAIEENSNIDREIIVKGYTQAVHTDREKMGFRVARTRIYKNTSFFIDYHKLIEERRRSMRAIRSLNKPENTTNEPKGTMLKAIRVGIRKGRR